MPRPAYESRLRNLTPENPMNVNHYVGFDAHKKTVSYCVKTADGRVLDRPRNAPPAPAGLLPRAKRSGGPGQNRRAPSAFAASTASRTLHYCEARSDPSNGQQGEDMRLTRTKWPYYAPLIQREINGLRVATIFISYGL